MGRFIRAYPSYTAEAVLDMPATRFFALYEVLGRLEAEENIEAVHRAAVAANPGEHGQALRGYLHDQEDRLGAARQKPTSTLVPGAIPMALLEETPGEIEALRERQRQADERIRAEWLARQTQQTPE